MIFEIIKRNLRYLKNSKYLLNKLGLSWAKLSSSWDWALLKI